MNARKGVAHVRRGAWPFRFVLVLATMAIVLAMTGCGSDTEETFPPSNGEPLYAPDAVGPFAVGRSSFTIVDPDREGRELPVDVWYPVDPEDATGDPSLYQVTVQIWIFPRYGSFRSSLPPRPNSPCRNR